MKLLCSRLFAYGTLRSEFDGELARLLTQYSTLIGSAKMQGRLYAVNEYPGMVLSQRLDEWVKGQVYELSDPAGFLPILDDYEGCGVDDEAPYEFERVRAEAILDSGATVQVWVYVYQLGTSGKHHIPSGDYLAHRDSTNSKLGAMRLLSSDEHFTVEGALIEAWASHKSFQPKGNQGVQGNDRPFFTSLLVAVRQCRSYPVAGRPTLAGPGRCENLKLDQPAALKFLGCGGQRGLFSGAKERRGRSEPVDSQAVAV